MQADTKPRRPLANEELRFLVRLVDTNYDENRSLKPDRHFHIVRQTANGHKIGACDISKNALDQGEGYFSYQFTPFLATCLEPYICDFCYLEAEVEERLKQTP